MSEANKPEGWPRTYREFLLERAMKCTKTFIEDPSSFNKEQLLSVINQEDIHQNSVIHKVIEVSDYECGVINYLYITAMRMCLNSMKLFLYRHIYFQAREHKMTQMMLAENDIIIKPYEGLFMPLKLFYFSYLRFNVNKEKNYYKELTDYVDDAVVHSRDKNIKKEIMRGYIILINDLSYNINQFFIVANFSRKELLHIFDKMGLYIQRLGEKIYERPLMGVLCTSISNWILKSRNDYKYDVVYKCVDNCAADNNGEIWMRKTVDLNDKREGVLIKEINSNKNWIKYDWAKKATYNLHWKSYVTCFSKVKPNDEMLKKYGNNVFGYKTDIVAEKIAPIYISRNGIPIFEQVVCFDVIYSQDEAKKELSYLFEIVNCFKTSNENKTLFLNEILSYWILSFKDKKWEVEKERRYQINLSNKEFLNAREDNGFLKINCSLLQFPDVINKENRRFLSIEMEKRAKYKAIAHRDYYFCNDCLGVDFDYINENKDCCRFCKSSNIDLIRYK